MEILFHVEVVDFQLPIQIHLLPFEEYELEHGQHSVHWKNYKKIISEM